MGLFYLTVGEHPLQPRAVAGVTSKDSEFGEIRLDRQPLAYHRHPLNKLRLSHKRSL